MYRTVQGRGGGVSNCRLSVYVCNARETYGYTTSKRVLNQACRLISTQEKTAPKNNSVSHQTSHFSKMVDRRYWDAPDTDFFLQFYRMLVKIISEAITEYAVDVVKEQIGAVDFVSSTDKPSEELFTNVWSIFSLLAGLERWSWRGIWENGHHKKIQKVHEKLNGKIIFRQAIRLWIAEI